MIWSDIDRFGNFYVTGATSSADCPTTAGALQTAFGGGDADAFITKLDPTGSQVVYSTYLGGSAADFAIGLDVDRFGSVVVTGGTNSPESPRHQAPSNRRPPATWTRS